MINRLMVSLIVIMATVYATAQEISYKTYMRSALSGWTKKTKSAFFWDDKIASTSTLVPDKTLNKLLAHPRYHSVEEGITEEGSKLLSRYAPDKALDGKEYSAWVEGVSGPGIGEGIILLSKPGVTKIDILPGLSTKKGYKANNRPRELLLEVYEGPVMATQTGLHMYLEKILVSKVIKLRDTPKLQSFSLPQPDKYSHAPKGSRAYAIGLSIRSVYAGSHYDDTCLSEIRLYQR